ncbi:hypothetical protein KQI65_08390 [bacterium]|nr:hypothetical protein [bacterium]
MTARTDHADSRTDHADSRTDHADSRIYVICAGAGVLLFFLGPALALLADFPALGAATIGYAGIMLFTGGIAARYGFALGATPWKQLGRNLAVAAVVTLLFYLIFLLLYLI